jgi:Ca2+-binding EF-hand superfamily protein
MGAGASSRPAAVDAEKLWEHTVTMTDVEAYLERQFLISDRNHDYRLDPEEFMEFLKNLGLNMSESSLRALREMLDLDHDGKVVSSAEVL